jgi:hypothetical protein
VKRDPTNNKVTLFAKPPGIYMTIGTPPQPTLVTTSSNSEPTFVTKATGSYSEKFVLGKIDGERGFL